MIKLYDSGIYLVNGKICENAGKALALMSADTARAMLSANFPQNSTSNITGANPFEGLKKSPIDENFFKEQARKGTIAYDILKAHHKGASVDSAGTTGTSAGAGTAFVGVEGAASSISGFSDTSTDAASTFSSSGASAGAAYASGSPCTSAAAGTSFAGSAEPLSSLNLMFDSLTSHDITYVGIIQTARASGLREFPIPYVMTNCHNSLCAVGGTINEDDHKFGLSAARKYGGIYVPANVAVIHSYNREMMSGCGRMILGSDSHTRYGALGTMGVGEGGGELAKQIAGRTYDFAYPGVVAVYLTGKPKAGVGPQDVALAICGAVYENGYTKNKVMEFVGPGIKNLPIEYRNGIDVMTTETACWTSIWETDEATEEYFAIHGRPEAYKKLAPADVAYYDGCVYIDLSTIECTIALPMHPSYAYTIRELLENPGDILKEVEDRANSQISGTARMDLMSKLHSDGNIYVDQGIIAGCSGGTYDSLMAAARIMKGHSAGSGAFTMSVYPGSLPVYAAMAKNGAISDFIEAGVIVRECFCGPCFGAGDCPANGEFSIRHATRNFPNREGSKPGEGQMSAVALMDARSIAATAINGGRLTAASDLEGIDYSIPKYYFDKSLYEKRVYDGWGKADPSCELKYGPNIKDWPEMPALSNDLLVKICSYITDPVTTTDELIPSGETSSYRSNPERLSEFALSRKDPGYVGRAKAVREAARYLASPERGGGPAKPVEGFAALYKANEEACLPCHGEVSAKRTEGFASPEGAYEADLASPERGGGPAKPVEGFTSPGAMCNLEQPEEKTPTFDENKKEPLNASNLDENPASLRNAGASIDSKTVRETARVYSALAAAGINCSPSATNLASAIFANSPGDGSAREQAASCQRVLGAGANFAKSYATKRYRSNCINWGIIPFLIEDPSVLSLGDYVFIPGIRATIMENAPEIEAYVVKISDEAAIKPVPDAADTVLDNLSESDDTAINSDIAAELRDTAINSDSSAESDGLTTRSNNVPGFSNKEANSDFAAKPGVEIKKITVSTGELTRAEREIIACGCLINYYRS